MDKRPIILLDGVAVRREVDVGVTPITYIEHGPAMLMLKPKHYAMYYEIEFQYWNGDYEKYEAEESTMSIRPSGRLMLEFRNCKKMVGVNYE